VTLIQRAVSHPTGDDSAMLIWRDGRSSGPYRSWNKTQRYCTRFITSLVACLGGTIRSYVATKVGSATVGQN